jgi:uncharacterized membrane protein YqjE
MAGEGARSIAAVLTDIVGNVQQIIRAEIRLAKVEVRQEVNIAARSAMLLIVGGVVAVLALGVALLAGVYALAIVVAPWLAALIVAGAVGAIAGALIASGITQMHQVSIALPKTVATIEESIQWAKTPTR